MLGRMLGSTFARAFWLKFRVTVTGSIRTMETVKGTMSYPGLPYLPRPRISETFPYASRTKPPCASEIRLAQTQC